MYIYDETKNQWIPRRHTGEYKKKKKLVRDAWIIAGLLMSTLPISFMMGLALLTTFVSLMFLDESMYHYNVHR
ncbi:MAG TPA: hypothetical protein VIM41_02620 [Gammaproteobacteria bacterium]